MTKKIKIVLMCIFAAVCLACAFAGCKIGSPGREEVLKGFKAHVIYYSNGGLFDNSTTITVREMYFKDDPATDGVPFFDVKKDTSGIKVEKKGYDLVGWYLPEKYESGERAGEIKYYYEHKDSATNEVTTVTAYPRLDENGDAVTDDKNDRPTFYCEEFKDVILESQVGVVCSDEHVTHERVVGDDETLIVCAKWAPSLKIEYILSCEEGKTFVDAGGKSYQNGDKLDETEFGDGEEVEPASLAPVSLAGATFIRTYLDAALTEKAAAITRPEGESPENVKVYSYYKEGDWTVVSNTDTTANMFNNLNSTKKYYIVDDVEYNGSSLMLSNGNFDLAQVTIEGHGMRTLSNLTFDASGVMQGAALSAFGSLGGQFSIKNVTLKDVKITVQSGNNFALFAMCDKANAAAKFENFKLDGVTATVTIRDGREVTNAVGGGRNYWLFGGKGSDEAFIAEYGVQVTGANTLTIGGASYE